MTRTLIFLALIATISAASAEPWTYHGTLKDGGKPANGEYDFRLTLVNEAGTKSLTPAITLNDVAVKDGSFSAEVDFGIDLSEAPILKLKTEVSQGGSGFIALGEPTRFDAKAALAGICWDTAGNSVAAGEFLGSTNAAPLVFKANNLEVLRISAAPGGANIALGINNTANGFASVVSGGASNHARGDYSTASGGIQNEADGIESLVAGGSVNRATARQSTVGGGSQNRASGAQSTVSGGFFNCAGGDVSWAGGLGATTRHGNEATDVSCGTSVPSSGDADGDQGTFVWADRRVDGNGIAIRFTSNGPNQFAIRAAGGLRWDGTGVASTTSPAFTQIVNTASNTCDGGSGVANSRMIVTHPLLNNNPNAVVLFSANFGTLTAGGGAPPRNPLAIYYSDVVNGTCPAGRWIIYQTSVTAEVLNNNSRYNIWFVLP